MRLPHPKTLTWREVRPNLHRFNANIDHVAASAWRHVPTVGGTRSGWERDVSRAFLNKYGKWTLGWCWGVGEATLGGGPVHAWCCPEHSYTTHDDTARLCAQSLIEWRSWIELLAKTFVDLKPASAEAVGPAATSLIMQVAQRTEARDVWDGHAAQVVLWFLESHGVDTKTSTHIVNTTVSDKLEGWTEPDDETLTEIDRDFAKAATPLFHLQAEV